MTSLSSHISIKSCSLCIFEKISSSDENLQNSARDENSLKNNSENENFNKIGNRAEFTKNNFSTMRINKNSIEEHSLKNIYELSVSEFSTPRRKSKKFGEKINKKKNIFKII